MILVVFLLSFFLSCLPLHLSPSLSPSLTVLSFHFTASRPLFPLSLPAKSVSLSLPLLLSHTWPVAMSRCARSFARQKEWRRRWWSPTFFFSLYLSTAATASTTLKVCGIHCQEHMHIFISCIRVSDARESERQISFVRSYIKRERERERAE